MAKASEVAVKESGKIQDSTTKLPMVDLKTAIEVVGIIRDKAVETAAMPQVATALGYANATSTPFYRRISSARLFGLLSSRSALTQSAIDYIKPHDEQMKVKVLRDAVTGIPYYLELIGRYAGKKLNVDLVANAVTKDWNLTDSCALICAKAFESSLVFAGMMSVDGTVQAAPKNESDDAADEKPAVRDTDPPPQDQRDGHDTQDHSLYLDKDKSRKFSFTGPLEISRPEYERICKWLEFTMIII